MQLQMLLENPSDETVLWVDTGWACGEIALDGKGRIRAEGTALIFRRWSGKAFAAFRKSTHCGFHVLAGNAEVVEWSYR